MTEATSFWGRRRAAVAAEAEAEAQAEQLAQEAVIQAELAEKDDAEILDEMGLPDPAQMQMGDDFSAFMDRGVPERLRKQALRTLWRSNPVLANVDGLNDYDEDFSKLGIVDGPVKTAYQVGKGMLKHVEEMARQAEAAEAADREREQGVAVVAEDAGEDTPDEIVVLQPEEVTASPALTDPTPYEDEHAQDDFVNAQDAPLPRRMRFRFEEANV